MADGGPSCHAGASTQAFADAMATLVHGLGYLAVTALITWLVVDRLGRGLLRKACINLDAIWEGTLILNGCLNLIG